MRVPSETMIPTIPVGGRIEVNVHAYEHARPQLGRVERVLTK